MKYVALLRGINVGGNNIIKMTDLKKAVEELGFKNVQTFIQSGNVIFESDNKNRREITAKLEASLQNIFAYDSRVVVRDYEQFKKIISEIPADWEKRRDLRCYIAFIREPKSSQDVAKEINLKEGIDFIKQGQGIVYMSTLLSGITRSSLTKLVSKEIYKDITIRNYNTVRKLMALMEN
jgi:uncharacterized protein (DUF1697 family)